MAFKPISRLALAAASAITLAAGANEPAQAQTNRKIDNSAAPQQPVEDYAPTPGTRGSQTEALGAYLYVLPKMLRAIPRDANPGAIFGGANKTSQSITVMLNQLFETRPHQRPALEAILHEHGYFQSLDEWALTGDEFTLGMIAASMKRDNRSYYDRIFTLTPEELASMSDELRPTFVIIREFSDEEHLYYEGYLDYYTDLLKPYTAQP